MPKSKGTKYAIDSELLPYCRTLPNLPKSIIPVMQKILRMAGKKLLKDDRIETKSFG